MAIKKKTKDSAEDIRRNEYKEIYDKFRELIKSSGVESIPLDYMNLDFGFESPVEVAVSGSTYRRETFTGVFLDVNPDMLDFQILTCESLNMDTGIQLDKDGNFQIVTYDYEDMSSSTFEMNGFSIPKEEFERLYDYLYQERPKLLYAIVPTEEFSKKGWETEWGLRSADDCLYEASGLTGNVVFANESDAKAFFKKHSLDVDCFEIRNVSARDIAIPRKGDKPCYKIIDADGLEKHSIVLPAVETKKQSRKKGPSL